ncbi:hypothetical protein ACWD4B_34410 [Streptomyces sp. NPDC002536]
MANPHQQSPHGEYDPAGSTQMFRAFVDDGPSPAPSPAAGPGRRAAARSSGPGAGVILGVIVAIVVVAGAAWLAFS